ncbi:DEKNAAC104711 [Brettanomyces naardenensis]|uniref:DEKNAAC104711 n=1 Tax=Brettanomyces naardenensis TaxID=13370 RepID=A0A448YRC6_BRENA|nr:DEKNAAC104711 [Brettanomyces naardenensis]
MDDWTNDELDYMESLGNRRNHQLWNNRNKPFPYDDEDKDAVIMFLRDKYIEGKFRTTPIREEDYNMDILSGRERGRRGRGRRDRYGAGSQSRYNGSYGDAAYGSSRSSLRSDRYERENSRRGGSRGNSSLKLHHRSPTKEETRRYGDIARKMKFDRGYEDMDLNIEALTLTHGNIDDASEMVKKDLAENVVGEGTPPPLPRRKDQSSNGLNSTTTDSYNWLDSDAVPQPSSNPVSSANSSQIYQYVDPNTGAYYYIDSNGQQYIDPTQQQQLQARQMAVAQQQLQQQRTAAVLSLYNQPQGQVGQSALQSSVPSLNQLQQQQQQQQLRQQQLQQQQFQQQQLQQQQLLQQYQASQQPQNDRFTGF